MDGRQSEINFAFWNVRENESVAFLTELVGTCSVDVLCVAECSLADKTIESALTATTGQVFTLANATSTRTRIFTRSPGLNLREGWAHANQRISIRKLQFAGTDFNFVVGHLISRMQYNVADQTFAAVEISKQIRDWEKRVGHRRTILCGDLNMNPFDPGMVTASGLHALATQTSVMRGSRVVQGEEYPLFYNPMWGCFGDRSSGPPGTFFYRDSGYGSIDWHIFDQVLFRPDALNWFGDVRIVSSLGGTCLARKDGKPNKDISDHFPIVFSLRDSTDGA